MIIRRVIGVKVGYGQSCELFQTGDAALTLTPFRSPRYIARTPANYSGCFAHAARLARERRGVRVIVENFAIGSSGMRQWAGVNDPWTASSPVYFGTIRVPTAPAQRPPTAGKFIYKAIAQSGGSPMVAHVSYNTGSSEPNWGSITAAGQTIDDGSVRWVALAPDAGGDEIYKLQRPGMANYDPAGYQAKVNAAITRSVGLKIPTYNIIAGHQANISAWSSTPDYVKTWLDDIVDAATSRGATVLIGVTPKNHTSEQTKAEWGPGGAIRGITDYMLKRNSASGRVLMGADLSDIPESLMLVEGGQKIHPNRDGAEWAGEKWYRRWLDLGII